MEELVTDYFKAHPPFEMKDLKIESVDMRPAMAIIKYSYGNGHYRESTEVFLWQVLAWIYKRLKHGDKSA